MVAFDAVGPAGGAGHAFTTGPGTWTHINNGNSIFVGVTIFGGGSNTVTAVTYGGVSIPLIKFEVSDGGANGGVVLYGLVGPTVPTGSNTVSVTASETNNHNAGSVSLSGAGTIGTPFFAASGATSTTFSVDVTGTTTGGLIVTMVCQGTTAPTATAPNVLRWSLSGSSASSADNGAMGTDPSNGGTVTVAWADASSDDWGQVSVEVLDAGASGPFTSSPRFSSTWLHAYKHGKRWPHRLIQPRSATLSPVPPQLNPALLTSPTPAVQRAETW